MGCVFLWIFGVGFFVLIVLVILSGGCVLMLFFKFDRFVIVVFCCEFCCEILIMLEDELYVFGFDDEIGF